MDQYGRERKAEDVSPERAEHGKGRIAPYPRHAKGSSAGSWSHDVRKQRSRFVGMWGENSKKILRIDRRQALARTPSDVQQHAVERI
jgi:hypothetical protein